MLTSQVRQKSMAIRQLNTAWLEAGERGRPILFFCHGFPDDPHVWSHQMEALSDRYHVIAPFVRGCDQSAAAEDLSRYSREAILLDHLEILREVSTGSEPVICVGHDLGVVHAMTLTRRLGSRAAGLVVINGLDLEMFARRMRDPAQVARSWYMGLMQVPMLPEALATWAPHTASWLTRYLAGGADAGLDHRNFDRRTLGPLNQYRAFARETVSRAEKIQRIQPPVLVIWGRDDGVLVAPTQKEWDLVALNATVRIIPGGHWLHRDESDKVTGFISSFAEGTGGFV